MSDLQFSIFSIITLLGSLQGFLLCILFVSSKRFYRKSNRYLVLLIFAISMTSLFNAFQEIQLSKVYPAVAFCIGSWSLLIPFALYYFIQYLINPEYRFQKIDYWITFLSCLQLFDQVGAFVWYLIASESVYFYWKSQLVIDRIIEIIGATFCLVVIISSVKKLNQYEAKLSNQYAHLNPKGLNWLKNSFIYTGILWLLWVIPLSYYTIIGSINPWFFYPLELGLAFIIYWLGYSIYFQKNIFESIDLSLQSENIILKTSEKKPVELSDKTEEHYQKLLKLMEEDKIYQNEDLNMSLLAEKMNLSNGYLSQIINQKEGKSFFDFVNHYRIEEVKNLFQNPDYNHFSILGIASEAGFKSKSTFNAVFKKSTGQTPSAFRKQVQNSKITV